MSEYWIYRGGDVHFADGDIGDYNHEGVVIHDLQIKIIDQCENYFEIRDKNGRPFADSEYIDWEGFKEALSTAYAVELIEKNPEKQQKIEDQLEYDPNKFLFSALKASGIKKPEWDTAEGVGDARDYAMQRWGWKTFRNDNIDTWFFKQEDLADIIRGIDEIAEQEGWTEKKLNKKRFTINVFSSRKSFYLSYKQLNNPRSPSQENPIKTNLINYNAQQATQQVKNIDLQNIHPAYKRPGVNPFGDHTLYSLPTFVEWLKKKFK